MSAAWMETARAVFRQRGKTGCILIIGQILVKSTGLELIYRCRSLQMNQPSSPTFFMIILPVWHGPENHLLDSTSVFSESFTTRRTFESGSFMRTVSGCISRPALSSLGSLRSLCNDTRPPPHSLSRLRFLQAPLR
jgi:hypothetical protein